MVSKQPSRKGKKAWRKNVDISAVQTGLEQLRSEIIHGGVIKEKPDSNLFTLDTTGDSSVAAVHRLPKPLKCDEILSQRSAVAAVSSRVRTGGGGSIALATGIVRQKARRKDGISHAQLQRLRALAYGGSGTVPSGVLSAPSAVPSYDPWQDASPPPSPTSTTTTTTTTIAAIGRPAQERDSVGVKPPKTLAHKPVALSVVGSVPAVRLPEPGTSYNPEFAAWDALLQRTGAQEVEAEKKRLAAAADEARILALAAEPDAPSSSSDDDDDDDGDDLSQSESEDKREQDTEMKPRKADAQAKRKTRAQRHRELRHKALLRQLAAKKREARQAHQLHLIKKYARDLARRDRLAAQAPPAVVDDEKDPKIMRKRKFGKVRLPPTPLELQIQLPDELSDSLRTLKPARNLLSDRFRSFHERGLLEARARIVHAKKARRTVTEKWSFKDFK